VFPSPLPELPPGSETVVCAADGQPLASYRTFVDGIGSAVVAVFDTNHQLISTITAHADGDTETTAFNYERARVSSSTLTTSDGWVSVTDFNYDDAGQLIGATTSLPGAASPSETVLTYQDHQITETVTDAEGHVEVTVYRLDPAGRVIGEEGLAPDSQN
jgi:hypothetical protein